MSLHVDPAWVREVYEEAQADVAANGKSFDLAAHDAARRVAGRRKTMPGPLLAGLREMLLTEEG